MAGELSAGELSELIWNSSETEIIELKDAVKRILQQKGIPELTAIEEVERVKDEVRTNINYKIESVIKTESKPKFRFSDSDPYRLIGTANMAYAERTRELLRLSGTILIDMSECNSMLESMKCEPIFAATSNTFKNIPLLTSIVKNKGELGEFIDALYMLFYDDVSEGKDLLIPKTYYTIKDPTKGEVDSEDFIIFEIKVLRTSYRHDSLAWTNPEGRTEEIAEICKRYTNKPNILMFSEPEFYKFQVDLLRKVSTLLDTISNDLKAEKQIDWKKRAEKSA